MRLATLATIALMAAMSQAGEPVELDNETARVNYSLGYQVGGDFRRQGVEIDPELIIRGIEDALSGAEPLLPPEKMQAKLMELKRRLVADQRARRRDAELEYLAEGREFLEQNAEQPGVKTTGSGLQYRIVAAGTGKTPQPGDQVTVHYRGTLINGNPFDSSYQRGEPATFRLDGVIKGWTEGLQLIREGGRIELFIPPELAYGGRGPLAHRTLIFDVELISVGSDAQAGDRD
jgi:FKBP-type peptidyl-prolyl cis-trans isomerase FklB